MEPTQTAVDWLVGQLESFDVIHNALKRQYNLSSLISQARQLEKNQIMTAWSHGVLAQNDMTGEQYYNENYGK